MTVRSVQTQSVAVAAYVTPPAEAGILLADEVTERPLSGALMAALESGEMSDLFEPLPYEGTLPPDVLAHFRNRGIYL